MSEGVQSKFNHCIFGPICKYNAPSVLHSRLSVVKNHPIKPPTTNQCVSISGA